MNLRPVAQATLLVALICFISPFRPVAAEHGQQVVDAGYKLSSLYSFFAINLP